MQTHDWALVLAAGAGCRRRWPIRTDHGQRVPRPFWRIGDTTLAELAFQRARRVVAAERVVACVAADDVRLWGPKLARAASPLTITQPFDRGTAAGVLLPLLAILARDPAATVLVLPASHFIADEPAFAAAAGGALTAARRDSATVVVLDVAGESAVERGAPNGSVFAAKASTLRRLYERHLPALVGGLRDVDVGRAGKLPSQRLLAAYESLPTRDLDRHLLQPAASSVRLVRVPPCGLTDVGTPADLRACRAAMANAKPATGRRHPRFRGSRLGSGAA